MCRHSQPKERHNLFGHDFRPEIGVVDLKLCVVLSLRTLALSVLTNPG